jgi:hypothetical protein
MAATRRFKTCTAPVASLLLRWLPRLLCAVLGAYTLVARPWLLRWGARPDEASTSLPGDDFVPDATYVTTRAITVQAPAEAIWPWLVQLGQGRAGFYTYDRLEQVVGAAIRSADHIVPELQQLAVGDTVNLSPVGGPKVALLDPGHALVLFETMDLRSGQSIPSLPPTRWAMDWSWLFMLRPMSNGATRLLIRTRGNYRPHRLLAPAMAILLEPVHFVMERGMLLGIKRRAEHTRVAARAADSSALRNQMASNRLTVGIAMPQSGPAMRRNPRSTK